MFEWFLKDHVTLKTGVIMLKIQLCHHRNKAFLKYTSVILNSNNISCAAFLPNLMHNTACIIFKKWHVQQYTLCKHFKQHHATLFWQDLGLLCACLIQNIAPSYCRNKQKVYILFAHQWNNVSTPMKQCNNKENIMSATRSNYKIDIFYADKVMRNWFNISSITLNVLD